MSYNRDLLRNIRLQTKRVFTSDPVVVVEKTLYLDAATLTFMEKTVTLGPERDQAVPVGTDLNTVLSIM